MTSGLLGPGETPPFTVWNPGAPSPFVLIGDHAGHDIPLSLNKLQLGPADLGRHIALDIGVAGMGRALAGRLNACLITQRYSRLVIDCNRDPARSDAICEVSDGTVVPGNLGLSRQAREQRIAEIFEPYHQAIAGELDARQGRSTVLLALHSFTPVMGASARPWRFGVLHLGGSPYSDAALAALRAEFGEAAVGDNQPYRMDAIDYSVPRHAIGRGLDYLELEVRQDLLATPQAEAEMAERLAPILERALAAVG